MNTKNFSYLFSGVILILLLSACAPESRLVFTPTSVARATSSPSPTIIESPEATETAVPVMTATDLPSPTPTPRVHAVKIGETMLGIAWQYGVSLDALIALNPDVPPYAMSVGTELLIPYETVVPANQTPVPTAIAMPIKDLNCVEENSGGIWCFLFVENTADYPLESIIVNVNIADMDASEVFAQQASSPLNVLQPGQVMPFAVYFAPDMPSPFQSSAQFVSAVPLEAALDRYVSVEISTSEIEKAADDKVAFVQGNFKTVEAVTAVRIVAVAFDQEGRMVGLRRWQNQYDSGVQTGSFELQVFAAQGSIDRVEILAEAQP